MVTHTMCYGAVHHIHNPGRVGGKHETSRCDGPTQPMRHLNAEAEPVVLEKCKHETAVLSRSSASALRRDLVGQISFRFDRVHDPGFCPRTPLIRSVNGFLTFYSIRGPTPRPARLDGTPRHQLSSRAHPPIVRAMSAR